MTHEDQVLLKQIQNWKEDHQEEFVEELKLWVSQPSVSREDLGIENAPYGPDCRKMMDLVIERSKHYNLHFKDYNGYVLTVSPDEKEENIGIVAHLDVVPEGDHWIYEPYQPIVKEGWMIGRGCGDNKGPGVLGLFVSRCLKDLGIPLKHGITMLYGCAEETGMQDFPNYIKMGGPIPAVSIVADASFPLCVGQKGSIDANIRIPKNADIVEMAAGTARNIIPDYAYIILKNVDADELKSYFENHAKIKVSDDDSNIKIESFGTAGHAAFPEGSENAISLLCQEISNSPLGKDPRFSSINTIASLLKDSYGSGLSIDCEDELSGRLTSNGGIIKTVGNEFDLTLDIRTPVTLNVQSIAQKLCNYVESVGCMVFKCEPGNPYYIDPKDPKVITMMNIYNELTGESTEPYTMGGGTYSKAVPNAITFGPGLTTPTPRPSFMPDGHGNAHGPDEMICIDDLMKAFDIYALSLIKLDNLI